MRTGNVNIDIKELKRRAEVLAADLYSVAEISAETSGYAADIALGLDIVSGYITQVAQRVDQLHDPVLRDLIKHLNV